MTVPEGWRLIELGDFLGLLSGYSFSSKRFVEPGHGQLPLIRIRDLETQSPCVDYDGEFKDKYIVRHGDIVIGMDGDFNICLWSGPKALLNQRVCKAWSGNEDILDDGFLYYSLQPQLKTLNHRISGTTVKHLSQKHLRSLSLTLPPLPEQKKIAEILGSVDGAIQATQKTIDQTERVKKGLLQQLLTRGIGHTRFKKTEIGEIPEEWEVKQLGELGEFANGINKSKQDFGSGCPFVNLNDVFGTDEVSSLPEGLVRATHSELERYSLERGDVLFVRSSVKPEGVGLAAVVTIDMPQVVYSGFLIRFRQSSRTLLPSYMRFSLNEKQFRDRLLAMSTVSANTNINQQSLKSLMVAVPPIHEQMEVSEILTNIDLNIKIEGRKKSELEGLKTGLMQDLLTGDVRVVV